MVAAQGNTPQITQAINEILARLEPLRAAGIICRGSANTPGASGQTLASSQIVVWWLGDSDFSPLKAMGSQQTYKSSWVLLGRMSAIKSANGLEAVRDVLYALLGGLRLTGYADLLRVESFTVGQRASDHQPFEMTVSAVGKLINCVGDETDGVADIALGALLAAIDLETDVVARDVVIGSPG
jgi:hypothetical protein